MLQKKSVAAGDSSVSQEEKIKEGIRSDAFVPPYNPSLHVGDLQGDDGTNYIVLVRGLWSSLIVFFLNLFETVEQVCLAS